MLELWVAENINKERMGQIERVNRTAWRYTNQSAEKRVRNWGAALTLSRLRMTVRIELNWGSK